MGGDKELIVIGAAYDNVADAMKDYAQMQDFNVEGEIADYDAAIVTKEPSGMVVLSNADSTGHFKGAAAGAVVGGVLNDIAVQDPEILQAVMDVMETQQLLSSQASVDLLPGGANVLVQLEQKPNIAKPT